MWQMLQAEEPDDYVVATGEAHTVEEFVAAAFKHVRLDWREYVRRDESLSRGASDLPVLVGDPTKIRERLGWEPEVRFDELVALLVDADVEGLKAQAAASAR
jgi:GDPmannose 4,6-dehydratase